MAKNSGTATRPTLEMLAAAPEQIRRLEVAQLQVEAAGLINGEVVARCDVLLLQTAIDPGEIVRLRQQLEGGS